MKNLPTYYLPTYLAIPLLSLAKTVRMSIFIYRHLHPLFAISFRLCPNPPLVPCFAILLCTIYVAHYICLLFVTCCVCVVPTLVPWLLCCCKCPCLVEVYCIVSHARLCALVPWAVMLAADDQSALVPCACRM